MRLSAEQFAEFVSILDNMRGSTANHSDKRRSARMELQAQVPISVICDDQCSTTQIVELRDFSARGIAILYPSELKLGQQFIVELRRLKGRAASLLCTVMHARTLPDGRFSIGAEFTCVLQGAPAMKGSENTGEMSRIQKSMLR